MMTRLEAHVAARRHLLGRPFVRCQPLVQQGAHRRGTDGRAHVVPIDGWSGVQDHVALHARHHLASRPDVDQHLLRLQNTLQRDLVRRVDRRVPQTSQHARQFRVTFGWRSPIHALDRNALSGKHVREERRSNAQRAQAVVQQRQAATPSNRRLAATAA